MLTLIHVVELREITVKVMECYAMDAHRFLTRYFYKWILQNFLHKTNIPSESLDNQFFSGQALKVASNLNSWILNVSCIVNDILLLSCMSILFTGKLLVTVYHEPQVLYITTVIIPLSISLM